MLEDRPEDGLAYQSRANSLTEEQGRQLLANIADTAEEAFPDANLNNTGMLRRSIERRLRVYAENRLREGTTPSQNDLRQAMRENAWWSEHALLEAHLAPLERKIPHSTTSAAQPTGETEPAVEEQNPASRPEGEKGMNDEDMDEIESLARQLAETSPAGERTTWRKIALILARNTAMADRVIRKAEEQQEGPPGSRLLAEIRGTQDKNSREEKISQLPGHWRLILLASSEGDAWADTLAGRRPQHIKETHARGITREHLERLIRQAEEDEVDEGSWRKAEQQQQ